MLVHFFIWVPVLIGQKWETLSISPGWKKSAQILHPTQKVCNKFEWLIIFYIPNGFILSQQ